MERSVGYSPTCTPCSLLHASQSLLGFAQRGLPGGTVYSFLGIPCMWGYCYNLLNNGLFASSQYPWLLLLGVGWRRKVHCIAIIFLDCWSKRWSRVVWTKVPSLCRTSLHFLIIVPCPSSSTSYPILELATILLNTLPPPPGGFSNQVQICSGSRIILFLCVCICIPRSKESSCKRLLQD